MKTIQEQIAVMQHYADGGKVETLSVIGWVLDPNPKWNWTTYDYRIVEEADPYAELKAASADQTKQIRCKCFSDWIDSGEDWEWTSPPEYYEIRDKPKKVKLLAWFDTTELRWLPESRVTAIGPNWKRVPSEDKVIEVEV